MRASALILAIMMLLYSAAASTDTIQELRPSEGISSIRIDARLGGTQIHVTFAEDMIPLGGGHDEFPVRLEGPGDCNWGWRGPRTVSCLLDDDDRLPMAERYALVIDDGLVTMSGKPVPAYRMEFETDRPVVKYAGIDWNGPTEPLVYLYANLPVSVEELQEHLRIEPIDQSAAAISVTVVQDEQSQQHWNRQFQYTLQPDGNLEPGTAYAIRVLEGLTGTGSSLSAEAHDAGSFRTYGEFEFLGVGCSSELSEEVWRHRVQLPDTQNPDCVPEDTVAFVFTADPDPNGLYRTLMDAGVAAHIASTFEIHAVPMEKRWRHYSGANKTAYALTMRGFPAGAPQTVFLPAAIKDRFGRSLPTAVANFSMLDFEPAFIEYPMLNVVPSGSGNALELAAINTKAVVARFFRDGVPGAKDFEFETSPNEPNERSIAKLDVEGLLGKPWGVLIGDVAVDQKSMAEWRNLRGFPIKFARPAGAIVSPWDIVLGTAGVYSTDRHTIWVSDLETGQGVADAKVELVEHQGDGSERDAGVAATYSSGHVLGQGRTDKNGFAEIVPTGDRPHPRYPGGIRVSKGETVVFMPLVQYQTNHRNLYSENIGGRQKYWRGSYAASGTPVTWGISDKPLYRGGETARIKGYVRVRDDNRFEVPSKKTGWKLTCAARSNDLCTGKTVDLDEFGSFSTTVHIPEGTIDGDYVLSVSDGSRGFPAMSFRVASYKPKPHRVHLEIDAESVVGGDPVPISASTEYFAGGAVKNAKAQVIIETRSDSPPIPEPLLAGYEFSRSTAYWNRPEQVVIDSAFDEQGELSDVFELPEGSSGTGKASIVVGALHESGVWAYSEPQTVKYSQSSYLLGLKKTTETAVAGKPFEIEAVLINMSDGDESGLSIHSTLEYPTHRHRDRTQPSPEIADQCTVLIDSKQPVSCELLPTRIGQAIVRAVLMRGDSKLQEIEQRIKVRLTDQAQWRQIESAELPLKLRTAQLDVGDTADVIVDVPWDSATVMFAAHRENVIESWSETLSKGNATIRLPLAEKHAPGFTLVAIARPTGADAGTAIGSIRVPVQSSTKSPSLSVTTDKKNYKAGDEVQLTIKSSSRGPAQLTIAVVDEAVIDLVSHADEMYDPRGDGFARLLESWSALQWWQLSRLIGASSSMSGFEEIMVSANMRMSAEASAASLSLERFRSDKAGAAGEPLVRTRFSESAYFNPDVLTDNAGSAKVSFNVPDNLGQWRVIVVGTDSSGALFAANEKIDVALPLETRAALPARLIIGDSLEASASVLNRKERESHVALQLEVEAAGVKHANNEGANLGHLDTLEATTMLTDVSGDSVMLTATAQDKEDSDAIQIAAPVIRGLESRSWTSIAALASGESVSQPIQLPSNALQETATLSVVADKSVIGDLTQTFRYMQDLSYRSWETILSQSVVAAYAREWEEANQRQYTLAEIQNLLTQGSNFQNNDGGMSYFSSSKGLASDFLSAYTLIALSWANEQGLRPQGYEHLLRRYVYKRVLRGLRGRQSAYETERAPSERDMPIMIAALTTGAGDLGHNSERYSAYLGANKDKYDAVGLAYALIATTRMDAPLDLRKALSELLQARLVETFDRIEVSGGNYWFSSRSEIYCTVLSALQQSGELAPETRVLTKLIRGGYEFRSELSGFGNSYANATCVVALTRYRNDFEVPGEAISARVTAQGVEDHALSLDAETDSASISGISLPLYNDSNNVEVTLDTGSAVYASTNIQYEVDLAREVERSHGYSIKRTYAVFRDDSWRTVNPGDDIEQGEWVKIDLGITSPVVRRFVAITDPTPAGLEPVDETLASSIPQSTDARRRWWRPFQNRALSNEQSRFYTEWLSPGSHTVTYYAQATFAGEFLALPAKVESMYSDGVFATTTPARLTIKSKQ